jgi:hypothetical protein
VTLLLPAVVLLALALSSSAGEGVASAEPGAVTLATALALVLALARGERVGSGEVERPGMVAMGVKVGLPEKEAHMVGICVSRAVREPEGTRLPLAGALPLPLPLAQGVALGLPLAVPPPPPPPPPPSPLMLLPLGLGVALGGIEEECVALGLTEGAREVLGDLLALGQCEGAGDSVRWGEAVGV